MNPLGYQDCENYIYIYIYLHFIQITIPQKISSYICELVCSSIYIITLTLHTLSTEETVFKTYRPISLSYAKILPSVGESDAFGLKVKQCIAQMLCEHAMHLASIIGGNLVSDCERTPGINRCNLPLSRHAANEYGGWVKIVKRFRLSHEPSIERTTV